jgi:hypothetical protein
VDGLFYFDKHWYLVEIRWKGEKSNSADVSVLRDRASRSFGGDTKALFVSFNGFSKDCLEAMTGGDYERVILFDGSDLRCVLDCQIAFDLLLQEKQIELVKNKRPWVSAIEIIMSRLSWKWRKRSSVKITERTYEEGTEAFHSRGKSSHPEAASCGQSTRLGTV